ncbi:zinc knuckle-domain-containing protein [Truncatella angustata]|uniref:Zinc knuckle-domain-containing protein n=1 Tax=Truncatella angustata TaxID=152316 RepID=A0A9P8RNW7_9PEZI|nr:zinc knuckle-domain-containing protein [Truncatella angustata]KAH6647655.1 zinc knuckle-domain-containing protein [Truncatella angustata]
MYNRRGPSKGTSATAKCQKCLKNGHYSYECKANVQERPYIARPSRTQQLSNPKLIPKLTEAAPPELQKKEGVADQQLAKLEAERARKRELELDDDGVETRESPRRGRSASYDSVSTISTSRSMSKSPRPSGLGRQPEPKSPSPVRQQRHRSPDNSGRAQGTRRSRSPVHSGRGSSPRRPHSRGTRSPPRSLGHPGGPDTGNLEYDAHFAGGGASARAKRRYSPSASRSPSPGGQRRYRSRSANERRFDVQSGKQPGQQGQNSSRGHFAPPSEKRERSLSPFSKRLALTKSMHGSH